MILIAFKFEYRTRAIITHSLYIYYPLFQGQKRYLRSFFHKIQPLCMVSIQDRFIINMGLWWQFQSLSGFDIRTPILVYQCVLDLPQWQDIFVFLEFHSWYHRNCIGSEMAFRFKIRRKLFSLNSSLLDMVFSKLSIDFRRSELASILFTIIHDNSSFNVMASSGVYFK